MRHLNTIQFVEYDYGSKEEMDAHHEEMKKKGWQPTKYSYEDLFASFMLLEIHIKKKSK
ncbi:hypothetical protein [Cohnella terricola]|uniref:hypothetical protein n=1 Tax=Cohnella terricola TaxID=1289167 RepID=UPI001647AA0D|nr:hypothetical protein [Cohnella terricola]